ncbi:MAG: carbamoyltransferase HypF [Candidatus Omnitrophica bacterium]|nr:carbamoyltransferase HypF [Candidatus Omnitrophota bacterium]
MIPATPLPNRNIELNGAGDGDGSCSSAAEPQRIRIRIQGVVQGVGFRPFIHHLAVEMGLAGKVWNTSEGVVIEAQGRTADLEKLVARIRVESPTHSHIHSIRTETIELQGDRHFSIVGSEEGEKTTTIPPDLATCPDCLNDILDPLNRRHRYPFTNCTHCGPRYSILKDLPYDRRNTSMAKFTMCEECRAEYEDPTNRRFHAQPNACPKCGPQLSLCDGHGHLLAKRDEALIEAEEAIRAGRIVALKGLGGFHLIVRAHDEDAIQRLRKNKNREEKPLAVMFPNIESARKACRVTEIEGALLLSAQSPIVLLEKRLPELSPCNPVAPAVAPHNPNLGVLLPYTPLHHLLLHDLGFPVVATSGNLSDEPICIDEQEALHRLRGIADLFLVHDRPIVRQVDDSILRIVAGGEMMLRRSRGYAPLPIPLPQAVQPTLAVGAHFKNTVAAGIGNEVYLSQHIGDLETALSYQAFEKTLSTFGQLKDFAPTTVAHDLHPDYLSTSYAKSSRMRPVPVQHHYAHVLSCMADREIEPPVLGLAWDGTGLGTDGTVWGSEFLRIDREGGFERVAHLRAFPLPGGDAASREPSRTAFGLLHSAEEIPRSLWMNLLFVKSFGEKGLPLLRRMLKSRINCPLTSSMGRLFDAVAAILGQRFVCKYEGQAAMELEFLIGETRTGDSYPLGVDSTEDRKGWTLDWAPMIQTILEEVRDGKPIPGISTKFHNSLAEAAVDIALRVGEPKVVLTGGCFQNRYLLERTIKRLNEEGFTPFWHQQVPPNDGGIAVGQVLAAAYEGRERPCV